MPTATKYDRCMEQLTEAAEACADVKIELDSYPERGFYPTLKCELLFLAKGITDVRRQIRNDFARTCPEHFAHQGLDLDPRKAISHE